MKRIHILSLSITILFDIILIFFPR